MRLLLNLIIIICAILNISAAPFLESGEKGKVIRVIDGDSFAIDKGLIVRLAQIEAPRIIMNDDAGLKSKKFLEELILYQNVELKYSGLKRDKMGRALAQVFIDKGLFEEKPWVNIEILKNGHARVHTYIDNRYKIGDFWLAERYARRNGLGLWNNPKYQARFANPNALKGAENSFQLVEGKVLEIIQTPQTIKLLFGKNIESDFSAIIPKNSWPLFENNIEGIYKLKNMNLRIRGKIQGAKNTRISKTGKNYQGHGPQIWLDHPEQIEYILPPK